MAIKDVKIIGVDLAKQVFQLHGAAADGSVVFRKKLSRKQFPVFMRDQPRCIVAMEALSYGRIWVTRADQAARFVASVSATPSVNLTPSMIIGKWLAPFRRRHPFDAAWTSL